MKLTTPEQKLIEAAKLDGWTMHKVYPHVMCYYEGKKLVHESNIDAPRIARYSTSYDAILPLIQKQKWSIKCEIAIQLRIAKQKTLVMIPTMDNLEGWCVVMLSATPSQLLDALLIAHGFELCYL